MSEFPTHVFVIACVLAVLALCAYLGFKAEICEFWTSLVLGLLLTGAAWLFMAILGNALVKYLHAPIFGGGEDDLVYLMYFFPCPIIYPLAIIWGARFALSKQASDNAKANPG